MTIGRGRSDRAIQGSPLDVHDHGHRARLRRCEPSTPGAPTLGGVSHSGTSATPLPGDWTRRHGLRSIQQFSRWADNADMGRPTKLHNELRARLAPTGEVFLGSPPQQLHRLYFLADMDTSRRVLTLVDGLASIYRTGPRYTSDVSLLEQARVHQLEPAVRFMRLSVRLTAPKGNSVVVWGRSETKRLLDLLPG